MNISQVRCWKVRVVSDGLARDLFITYPEDNNGHILLTCLNCGHLYSASVSKMIYIGPEIEQRLADLHCLKCKIQLSSAYALYPETYLTEGGIRHFDRPRQIPPDNQSIVKEFDEVY